LLQVQVEGQEREGERSAGGSRGMQRVEAHGLQTRRSARLGPAAPGSSHLPMQSIPQVKNTHRQVE
jgi:hypothetical protein